MQRLEEEKARGVDKGTSSHRVHYNVFKDNASVMELAKAPKVHPCTKHINAIYHHFRFWMRDGKIILFPSTSEHQMAVIFTKPLPQNLFMHHHKKLMELWK
eukprot:8834700-Ditylum_brightwellii.AAC.1